LYNSSQPLPFGNALFCLCREKDAREARDAEGQRLRPRSREGPQHQTHRQNDDEGRGRQCPAQNLSPKAAASSCGSTVHCVLLCMSLAKLSAWRFCVAPCMYRVKLSSSNLPYISPAPAGKYGQGASQPNAALSAEGPGTTRVTSLPPRSTRTSVRAPRLADRLRFSQKRGHWISKYSELALGSWLSCPSATVEACRWDGT
jgi:hypothetical protein